MCQRGVYCLVLLSAAVWTVQTQEPFPGFHGMMSGMQDMVSNLQGMGDRITRQGDQMRRQMTNRAQQFSTRMQRQGQQLQQRLTAQGIEMADRMNRQGERIRAKAKQRTEWLQSFGPGETQFNTTDGSTANIYNSPTGLFSSVVYSNGPSNRGYIFYSGPDGVYERQW